jgi:hypothetical protein
MNCKSVQSRLSAYLDRELGGDELLQMRAHMSVCRECRCEAEGLRVLKSLLGGIHCPEPPEDLQQKLTANMLRQRYEEPRKIVRVSALMFAGVTACSMLATLLVLNYGVSRHLSQTAARGGNGQSQIAIDGPFGGDGFGNAPILSAANFGPR